jgi:hypothetical protein
VPSSETPAVGDEEESVTIADCVVVPGRDGVVESSTCQMTERHIEKARQISMRPFLIVKPPSFHSHIFAVLS